ncbi:agarase [Arcticibacter tournemirensis]|uniref:Agarase n=1 Tax=Arcticibacter tournemirensis TaxID=699437 RepID=A0A4Q0MGS3_9SPHI|nr:agarase [Arcticibacter tournemirensis]RXF72156.1 agarase [Arcticibacter tournemirensis]
MVQASKYILFLCLISGFAFGQDSTEYALKVAARKGINHADGSNAFTAYKDYPTRTIGQLKQFVPKEVKLNRYGGRTDKRTKPTGFFYVTKIDDRWWAVDPEGCYYLHNAMNAVNMGRSDRNQQALKEKFVDETGWITKTHQILVENGFNGAGAWSNVNLIRKSAMQNKKPLAYTINLDWMSGYGDKRGGTFQVPGHKGYPNNVIFVFDPGFEAYCEEQARKLTEYKDDKNLFGYFSDNEIPLGMKNLDGYLTLKDESDPGYQGAIKWLASKGISRDQITDQHRAEFLGFVSDRYFSIVAKAIKKYDPNHMYLGCRFYGSQRNYPDLFEAAGKYVDVISINYYNNWTPQKDFMRKWEEWSGKPFIVTEWYVKADDSGLGNTAGAGWIVKTQEDRGLFYQNFTLGLLESGSCVGWHWFKYMDNDPTQKGAEPSNTNANKGIVDNYYSLYQPLVEKMKQLNSQMYTLADYFNSRKKKP